MKVCVFGLGYVGCVTAACLARAGHRVFGVDINPDKVEIVNAGCSPLIEPGLADLLSTVVNEGRLTATTDSAEAIKRTDVALVCVGTPSLKDGKPDVTAVAHAGREIGEALRGRTTPFTVILRSTSLPGTTERVLAQAVRQSAGPEGVNFRIAMNPEFMREGSSIRDFDAPPFVVVGCDDAETAALVRELYADVRAPFIHTAIATAELMKYACNAYHGLKVCFANEMGDLCDAFAVDAQDMMRIFAMDRKLNISDAYLRPGFAFGGSCLPKDLRALVSSAADLQLAVPLLSSVLPSNEAQIRKAALRILQLRKRRVSVVGLAFKPMTDDLRESPIVELVEMLIGKGCDVRILDRNVNVARLVGANRQYIEAEIPHISKLLCDDVAALLAHAEVLVLCNAGEDALAAAAAGSDLPIIDLTRTLLRLSPVRPANLDWSTHV
jgi:GDP-mannose 6-dehydrogenase